MRATDLAFIAVIPPIATDIVKDRLTHLFRYAELADIAVMRAKSAGEISVHS